MKNALLVIVLIISTAFTGHAVTTDIDSYTVSNQEADTPPPALPLTICEAPISRIISEQYPDPIGAELTITDLTDQTECNLRDLVTNPENGADSYFVQEGHTYQIKLQLYSDGSGSTIKDINLDCTFPDNVSIDNTTALTFIAADSKNSQPLMGIRMFFTAHEDLDLVYVEHSAKRSSESSITGDLHEMSAAEVDNFFNPQQGIFLGDLYGLSTYETVDQATTVTFDFQALKK